MTKFYDGKGRKKQEIQQLYEEAEACGNKLMEDKIMISKEGTLIEEGIENYEKCAYYRIFYIEYELRHLLETVIMDINKIPSIDIYIVVREPNGRSHIFRKIDNEKVERLVMYLDGISAFQFDYEKISIKISQKLNLKKEELFIHSQYIENYVIYLIINTQSYNKYLGLKYFYDRFAFASENVLSLKRYSIRALPDELVNETVRCIYSEFMNYSNKKIIPHFSLITKLSSMSYESSKCNAKIVCTHDEKQLDIKFANPVVFDIYNLRAVRKLLEIPNEKSALIIRWKSIEHTPFPLFEVLGFAEIKLYKDCPQFTIHGYLNWSFMDNEKMILNYCEGRYVVKKEDEIDNEYLKYCLNNIFGNNTDDDKIIDIVNRAWEQLHGTILIISSDIKNEVQRLCNKDRGYQIEELELSMHGDLITGITNIDGAVMINEFGKCYGIGVILDGSCIVKGNPSRGARFNSAYNYIANRKEESKSAIAVIISEDRTIDIITTQDAFDKIN